MWVYTMVQHVTRQTKINKHHKTDGIRYSVMMHDGDCQSDVSNEPLGIFGSVTFVFADMKVLQKMFHFYLTRSISY